MTGQGSRIFRSTAGFSAALGAATALLLLAMPAQAQRRSANRAHASAQSTAPKRAPSNLDAPHEALEKLAGRYTRVVKFLGQTGASAAPSYGTATFSVVVGGRFVLERSQDVVFGRPVEGLRVYGYDDATRQYEMVRMYTLSTAMTMMKGTSSDAGKTIDYIGEVQGPGASSVPLQARLRWESPSRFTVTMAMVAPNGKMTPFQETIYTRKK